MNSVIETYFDAIEVQLIESPAIVAYELIRREIALANGKLRLRATLSDGGIIEAFVFMTETDEQIELKKYSFHWQDVQGKLKRRWDNAPHFPHLPGAPDHIHLDEKTVVGASRQPDFATVLAEIEQSVTSER